MGAAACKNSKSALPQISKPENKNITIGVFGLDDAGKTSTVKAIDGEPTEDTSPTIGSFSTMVANPLNGKTQQNIKIIDVSGERKYRYKSWSQYYEQIHGLIFVIDASDRKRLSENQETLEDLLRDEKLKDKPVLILANKQDQKGAVNKEQDLKRQLEIDRLKAKYKIELCTAVPRNTKTKVDESIRKGFSWLIRAIEDNYSALNTRVKKTPLTRKFDRSESDEDDNRYGRGKSPVNYRSKITSEKLPSISTNKNQTKLYSDDDDDDYLQSKNELNKKKKLVGATTTNVRSTKKSTDNEPKAFRSTYESFPEETPWALSSSTLKPIKSDTTLPRLYGKPPLSNDTKKRGVSPLVHDIKPYTNGSTTFKRDNRSDDEDDYLQPKSKPINRFPSTTNTTKKSLYDEEDEDNYLKKAAATNFRKDYDLNENKTYPYSSTNRSNLNNDHRETLSKPGNYSKYDNDTNNRSSSSYTRQETRSKYDDDEDNHRWSSSKPVSHSKFEDDDDDYPTTKRSNYNTNNYPKSPSRYNDDDDYRPSTSSKPISHSKYSDDDDDDYHPSSSKKTNYPASYGGSSTTKTGSNRFKTNTDYGS